MRGIRITRRGVAVFAGIIILGSFVVWGAGYLEQRGENIRREQAIKQAEEALAEQSDDVIAVAVDVDQREEAVVVGTNGELPHTGASDLYPILVIFALALAGAYYFSSIRAVKLLDRSV